ncbi:MAG: C2H2-type zinc finger protein [Chloroflexi bacterium]|nr:C2H2-type zinc finger protein [Chloroflexota bacterium]
MVSTHSPDTQPTGPNRDHAVRRRGSARRLVQTARAAVCDQCGAGFRSNQGLAGHTRFRHADASWSASVDRAREQKAESLASFSAMPALPGATALLIAKLQRRYGTRRHDPSPTDCVICNAVCKTSQGLSGHMRYRHGAGGAKPNRRSAAELVRYVQTHSLPEPVAEAVWEKVLRMEGFRW